MAFISLIYSLILESYFLYLLNDYIPPLSAWDILFSGFQSLQNHQVLFHAKSLQWALLHNSLIPNPLLCSTVTKSATLDSKWVCSSLIYPQSGNKDQNSDRPIAVSSEICDADVWVPKQVIICPEIKFNLEIMTYFLFVSRSFSCFFCHFGTTLQFELRQTVIKKIQSSCTYTQILTLSLGGLTCYMYCVHTCNVLVVHSLGWLGLAKPNHPN